jgi:hypothetical protein
MAFAAIVFMAAANSYASVADATAPRTDELNSATTQSWAYAQNDGTIVQDVTIIDVTSTLVLQTTDHAFLTGHDATASEHGAFEGRTRDAAGIVLVEHVIITTSLEDLANTANKTQNAKTANTSGTIRV